MCYCNYGKPDLLAHPSLHLSPLVTRSYLSKSVSLFLLYTWVRWYRFYYSTPKWYPRLFVFLYLTSFYYDDHRQVYACCWQRHYFILFHSYATVYLCTVSSLSIHLPVDILVASGLRCSKMQHSIWGIQDIFFSWGILDLQRYVSFRCIAKWITYN